MYIADHSNSIVFEPIASANPLDSDRCMSLPLIPVESGFGFRYLNNAPQVVPSLRCVRGTKLHATLDGTGSLTAVYLID